MSEVLIALAGNQNCGKTTLFNRLTGSNQHVGNFPGVTVEKKMGIIKNFKEATPVSYTHLDVYKRQGRKQRCQGKTGKSTLRLRTGTK